MAASVVTAANEMVALHVRLRTKSRRRLAPRGVARDLLTVGTSFAGTPKAEVSKRPAAIGSLKSAPVPFGNLQSDVFICHATEDKGFVRPLAHALVLRGFEVWYDEFVLHVGDSLRREIDKGLEACRFGVVVLSRAFFAKSWPQRELDGLTQRETSAGRTVILPVWHEIDAKEIMQYSPVLADRFAVRTSSGAEAVADRIADVLHRSERMALEQLREAIYGERRHEDPQPLAVVQAEPSRSDPAELPCPHCNSFALNRGGGQYICEECGYVFVAA
jgi:TIR domain